MNSPVPGGVFMPFIILGCNIGRIYGICLQSLFNINNIGRFSIAGAAALSATTTRFLAMTILIIEVTRNIDLVFPIMITVMFSFGTGNLFTKSYFYSTIELKKLPYIPKLMKDKVYKLFAKDIMQSNYDSLKLHSNLGDIFNFLSSTESICLGDFLPILHNENYFVGVARIRNLVYYLRAELRKVINNFPKDKLTSSCWLVQVELLLKSFCNLDDDV